MQRGQRRAARRLHKAVSQSDDQDSATQACTEALGKGQELAILVRLLGLQMLFKAFSGAG
jgi:hypothetical protein